MRRSRHAVVDSEGISGAVRLDRSSARLLGRLQPGDIAVLDHVDLDATTAEALVARGVAAVVNASPSTSGRYPNLGPGVLVGAGIPLLDAVGDEVFGSVREGRAACLTGDTLWVGDREVARGVVADALSVAAASEQARAGLAAQLADLASNATGLLLDERGLLLEGVGIPDVTTRIADRHVLVVGAGSGAAAELRLLRRYRREHRPVVIGTEAGADLLLAQGITPDIVVGDPAAMSDRARTKARDVVGRSGGGRSEDVGVKVVSFDTTAAPEDMALLLADHAGAAVIVAVGLPTTLEEVLDRGRAGAASSLLVGLGVGRRVVGADTVVALTRQRFPLSVLLLLAAAAAAIAVAWASAGGNGFDPALLEDRWRVLLEQWPWWPW
jgi:uncharacterized membrane-anchored protein